MKFICPNCDIEMESEIKIIHSIWGDCDVVDCEECGGRFPESSVTLTEANNVPPPEKK